MPAHLQHPAVPPRFELGRITPTLTRGRTKRDRQVQREVRLVLRLREDQSPPLRYGNRITEFSRRVDPEADGLLGIGQCGLVRRPVRLTARQLGHFCDEYLIFFAPVDDHFVLVHDS